MTEQIDLEAAAKELAEKKQKIKAAKDRLAKRIKPDEDRVKELEKQIALNTPEGDNVVGDWHIKSTPGVRVDKDKLAEAYPQTEFPNLWKSEVLAGKVLDFIGKDEYSRFQLPTGKYTISVSDVSDED